MPSPNSDPIGPRDWPVLTSVLLACADKARAAIMPHFRTLKTAQNKAADGGYDPVTEADQAAERAIRTHIKDTFPDHGILGEEYGHEPGTSPITWVIDPVDGTRAFIAGAPTWGTLIAVNDGTKPVLGVMDQGFTGERFLGVQGAAFAIGTGALTPLRASATTTLDNALLAATDPRMFKTGTERNAFDTLEGQVRLSRYGLDCYAYCLLAMGHVDLVVEASMKPFDIQALIPVVEGAGGLVTDWQGASAQDGGQILAAATPELHKAAMAVLNG